MVSLVCSAMSCLAQTLPHSVVAFFEVSTAHFEAN